MNKHTHTVVTDNMSTGVVEAMTGNSESMLSEFLQQNRSAEKLGWACQDDTMEDDIWQVTYLTPGGDTVVVSFAPIDE